MAIIGGAKIEDKLPAVNLFSQIADVVLVGGKLPSEIKEKGLVLPHNVLVAKMDQVGTDLDPLVIDSFVDILKAAKQVVWSGPMGKYEDGATKGSYALAEAVISSGAESIIGGGDTITALDRYQKQFSFVSTGGGAMLEFLIKGTLPTIEALN